jgi:tetratricopeptide (TPR) repeat protein
MLKLPAARTGNKSSLLRASLPHGMPLARNLFPPGEYIPEVVRRLEGTSSGDIIVISGHSEGSGTGKTSVLAAVTQEERVQMLFCAMFWMNVGAYADDADLFGAAKVLAIDVYFTLRNLIESIAHDSETAHVMNKCGRILADIDSLESAENIMREIISATKKCLIKQGYGSYCPLLILDDLWSQRLLLLLRETGFTILVTTRYDKVLPDDQFAGCCYVLDPLPTEICLRLFFSLSPIDRAVFEKLPSSRDLVRLCASNVTPLELAVLAGLTHHWDPSALPLKLPDVLKKRAKIMSSADRMAWVEQHWKENPSIFTAKLPAHRGLLTTMLLSIETLDELVLKCYLSLVVVPPGATFEFEFLRSLWDLGDDELIKAVLDILVSRHLLTSVLDSPPLSSRQRQREQKGTAATATEAGTGAAGTGAGGTAESAVDTSSTATALDSTDNDTNTAPIPNMFSFEDSLHNHSKLEGLYQLHALHSDFLILCALNFAAVARKVSSSGLQSVLSFFENTLDSVISNWHKKTFSAETRCIIAITQSCDRAARYLASKDLLLSTDPTRMFLFSGYWKRLQLLNDLNVWEGLERSAPQRPCIIPYLQQRIRTEVELEGMSGARPFMTRACMMLELVNCKKHYATLEEWYRGMLGTSDAAAADPLEQARIMNCLGELLLRRGKPGEALLMHRKSLLIYPQFINEASEAGPVDSKKKKQVAEKGMLIAMENVALAITQIPRGDPDFDLHALTDATETQRLVVRMKLNIFGSNNVGLGRSISRLAEMLCEEGKYTEAIVEHEKALAVFAKKLGTNHSIYQSSRGEYGISMLHVAGEDETQLGVAVSTIQDAVVWLLHHGVAWEDPRIKRLRKYLPPDNIEYLTSSIVGAHYINSSVSSMFPSMCGLESLMSHSQDCAPIYDMSRSMISSASSATDAMICSANDAISSARDGAMSTTSTFGKTQDSPSAK